ncbi:hypothetical protein GGR51DRAFT_188530 [Nemania sp. FL0031]|nr:hypothetical protein GGR51DRAFT_188530 [Nemania sp. FL0031]
MTTPSPSPTASPTLLTDWGQTAAGCLRTDDYWIWQYNNEKFDARTVLGGPSQTTNCFQTSWDPTVTFVGSGCPPQYTSACQNTNAVVTCCPSAYDFSCQAETWTPNYNHAEWFRCVSAYASRDTVEITRTDFTQNTIAIEDRERRTDLHLFALALMFTTPASTMTTTPTSLSTSSPTASLDASSTLTASPGETTATQASTGLSSGAAAGVGVGVAAIVIILGVLAWLLYRRRKASKAPKELESSQFVAPAPPPSTAPGSYTPATQDPRGPSPYSAQYSVSPPTVPSPDLPLSHSQPQSMVQPQPITPPKELSSGHEPLFELHADSNAPSHRY